ncbi:hypothetical protein THAOC_01415 [Thalassiosira oceanica]|uniref:Uncharacterized protein n=1 Tax=Thalassiosira oceanica TaxID=159749 RepID=K0TIF8_THAOC|nr:hypothetical protein THAOC_01415 [Thalassiosira oceanica]|eukprot:EJK76804.1 hypothetical protein THAOC_01415 [Thalassiosira oceanica]
MGDTPSPIGIGVRLSGVTGGGPPFSRPEPGADEEASTGEALEEASTGAALGTSAGTLLGFRDGLVLGGERGRKAAGRTAVPRRRPGVAFW